MTDAQKTTIARRLERAYEAMAEAKVLMDAHHLIGAVNRFYYACFYAVTALGVRSLFNFHFVKGGAIAQALGKFYGDLFDARHSGNFPIIRLLLRTRWSKCSNKPPSLLLP